MRNPNDPVTAEEAARRAALSSPFRLELVGLFGEQEQLSVSDMAARTGRPATSLYHHLKVLEDAGVVRAAGTRPKGKRFETVYEVAESVLALAHDPEDPVSRSEIARAVQTTFRNVSRDFIAALDRDDLQQEGSARNIFNLHLHARLSPRQLADLNEWLKVFEEKMLEEAKKPLESGPDDQFLSFTIALAPIRGRRPGPTPEKEDES
jgi:predicted transcriptional regulator